MDVLDIAKKLFIFDEKYEGEINNALKPATLELRKRLLAPAFMRYMNSSTNQNILAVTDSDVAFRIKVEISNIKDVSLYDMIYIDGTNIYDGYFEVLSINDDSTFDILGSHTVTKTGTFSNETIENYKTAHAWLILYYTTFTFQKLETGKVLISSEDFGEGNIRTYGQDELNTLRDKYLRNAEMLIGSVNAKSKA